MCRKAERKWKKKTDFRFNVLRESLINYQKALRAAKSISIRLCLITVTNLIFYSA